MLELAGGNVEAITSEIVGRAYTAGDPLAKEIPSVPVAGSPSEQIGIVRRIKQMTDASIQEGGKLQASLAGTGVTISDGATNVMPVPPHAAPEGGELTDAEREENRRVVHRAWKIHFDDVRRSLRDAYYQSWDLHPGQLPSRYAAVFSFYLEARAAAAERLSRFVERAAHATLVGGVFDDAATGQGLLNFFLRGLGCGALTAAEAAATGLTMKELTTRSFVKILKARRAKGR